MGRSNCNCSSQLAVGLLFSASFRHKCHLPVVPYYVMIRCQESITRATAVDVLFLVTFKGHFPNLFSLLVCINS